MNRFVCDRCGTPTAHGAFEFRTARGLNVKCLGCALRHGPMLRRSAAIALVVGTVLVVINQGDVLLDGRWTGAMIWKLPLTYTVPFLVATWSALITSRVRPADPPEGRA